MGWGWGGRTWFYPILRTSSSSSSSYKLYKAERRPTVEASWNVMAHVQTPDFVFRRNGRVHLNRGRASVQLTTGSRGVRISGSDAGYTMSRESVKSTGYPLHSPVCPSLLFPCVTVCHHISTGVYNKCHEDTKLCLHNLFLWICKVLRRRMIWLCSVCCFGKKSRRGNRKRRQVEAGCPLRFVSCKAALPCLDWKVGRPTI